MLEAAVFDFDGIIIDTPSCYFRHMKDYLRSLNAEVSEKDISALVGKTFDDTLDYINRVYGLSVQREEFVEETSFKMREEMASTMSLDPSLKKMLDELRSNRIRLSIASSNVIKNIDFFLKGLEISDYFEHVVSFDVIDNPKPFPDAYIRAVGLMKKKPENCVAFEDTLVGVESAKKAGLKVVAIPNKFTLDHDFSRADLVVESFDELGLKKLKELFQ